MDHPPTESTHLLEGPTKEHTHIPDASLATRRRNHVRGTSAVKNRSHHPPKYSSDGELNRRTWESRTDRHSTSGRRAPKKRAPRRHRVGSHQHAKGRVATHCIAKSLDTISLLEWLTNTLLVDDDGHKWEHRMVGGDIVHSMAKICDDDFDEDSISHRSMFFFSFGCAVFWGRESDEGTESAMVNKLIPFCAELLGDDEESDDMGYCYGRESSIRFNEVVLTSRKFLAKPQEEEGGGEVLAEAAMEQLAVSYAFAQSNLLTMYEGRVTRTIESSKRIPQALAETGSVSLSEKSISKMIGQLFMERNEVNLHSDILDTPELFWDDDTWEPLYVTTWEYLDMGNRVEILNKRLGIMRELLDVLSEQQTTRHAHKLEWIVIWLIVVEVLIELVWNVFIKDVLGFFQHCGDN